MTKLKVAYLLPETNYLHGERGNIKALEKIAKEMKIPLEVLNISLGESFNPLDFDIIYLGAGELIHAPKTISYFNSFKNELIEFISIGKPLIVTGNAIHLFGEEIKRINNSFGGLGILNTKSIEKPKIYGDDIYCQINYNNKDFDIFGSQIQMADLQINNEEAFGKVIYGYGNNETKYEGIKKNNSIFTNILGPILVLNPWLTREILTIAAQNKKIPFKTDQLDFSLEEKSLISKLKYTKNKKTNLKN